VLAEQVRRWEGDRVVRKMFSRFFMLPGGTGGGYTSSLLIDKDEKVTYTNTVKDIGFEPIRQTVIDLPRAGKYVVFEFWISNYRQIDVLAVGLREDSITRVFFGRSRFGQIRWTFKPPARIAILNDFGNGGVSDRKLAYEVFTLDKSGLWFDPQNRVQFGQDEEAAVAWNFGKSVKPRRRK
jgi:hypothetical protein